MNNVLQGTFHFLYYFVLEEKFTPRADIWASATTDQLFEWAASDTEKSDNEEYVYNGDVEYNDEQEDEGENNVIIVSATNELATQ